MAVESSNKVAAAALLGTIHFWCFLQTARPLLDLHPAILESGSVTVRREEAGGGPPSKEQDKET